MKATMLQALESYDTVEAAVMALGEALRELCPAADLTERQSDARAKVLRCLLATAEAAGELDAVTI